MKAFIFVLLLLLVPFAAAAEIQKFAGYLDSGAVIPLQEKSLTITVLNDNNRIMVADKDGYILVVNGSCGIIDYTRICPTDIKPDYPKNTMQAYVKVSYLPLTATLTRQVPVFLVNDQNQINVTLANTGNSTIKDAEFQDTLPGQFTIVKSDCNYEGNTIAWKGDLVPNSLKECHYTVVAPKKARIQQTAKLTFFDGIVNQTVKATNDLISDFHVAVNYTYKEIYIGDNTTFRLKLDNIAPNSVDVYNMDFTFPDGVEITDFKSDKGTFTRIKQVNATANKTVTVTNTAGSISQSGDNKYSFKYFFDPGEQVNVTFQLTGRKVGVSNILIDGQYNYNNKLYGMEDTAQIKVNEPKEYIKITVDAPDVETYQDSHVKVWLNNTKAYSFKKIDIKVNSSLFYIPDAHLETLNTSNLRLVIDYRYSAPQVNATKAYPTVFTVVFYDQYNNRYEQNISKTINVKPADSLVITHSFSKNEGQAFVNVNVKNNRKVTVKNISVSDELDYLLEPVGLTKATLDLWAGQEVQAYSYKIKFEDEENKTYQIKTTAKYEKDGLNYTITKTSSIDKNLNKVTGPRVKFTRNIKSSATVGELVPVSMVIENIGDEPVELTLATGLTPDYDIMGQKSYNLGRLETMTKLTLNNQLMILPKKEGKIRILTSTLHFADRTENSSWIDMSVTKGYFQGPALTITKDMPPTAMMGETVEVNTTIKNIGTGTAVATVNDITLNLAAGQKHSLRQNFTFKDSGSIKLPETLAYYEHLGRKAVAGSGPYSINVTRIEIVEHPPVTDESESNLTDTRTAPDFNYIVTGFVAVVVLIIIILLFHRGKKPEEQFSFEGE